MIKSLLSRKMGELRITRTDRTDCTVLWQKKSRITKK